MTTEQMQIQLLGDFRLVDPDHGPIHIRPPRQQSLLAYLLLHPDTPQPRQHLAFLFWPDSSEKQAHTNLRNLLYQMRQTLPKAEQWLKIESNTLQWRSSASYRLDVAEFENAVRQADSVLGDGEATQMLLEQATNLYSGDLLPKLYDDWLVPKREQLRSLYLKTRYRLANLYEKKGTSSEAITCLNLLLQHDPLQEEAYRHLMRLHASSGEQAALTRVYRNCTATLKRELNVEPSPATQDLFAQLMAKISAPPTPGVTAGPAKAKARSATETTAAATLHHVPAQTTPCLGRSTEVKQISGRLTEETCNLLTLVGAGGVGKTRLAIQALEQLAAPGHQFEDDIYFVSLSGVARADLLPSAITSALGVSLRQEDTLKNQLLNYLRNKRLLLVLDNFEHLLPDVELLLEILEAAPGVKLLMTSREALRVSAEHRLIVNGLTFPTGQQSMRNNLASYSAVELFIEVASRIQPEFAPETGETQHAIGEICQLVEGTPLALEMAAAWVRLYDCQAIARQIRHSLDLLVTTMRDVPPRHRSMRVVLEGSWRLLGVREQFILAQASVFSGSFSVEAAMAVTDATPLDLAALVDKSLLRRVGDRFELHQLMRQFADEKRQWSAQTAVDQEIAKTILDAPGRHCHFYLELITSQEEAMFGREPQHAVARIQSELDNARSAWQWAVEQVAIDLISNSLAGLARFYELACLYKEGDDSLTAAAASIESRQQPAAIEPISPDPYGRILTHRAEMLIRQSKYDPAFSVATEAQTLAAQAGATDLEAHALAVLAYIYDRQSNYDQALAHLSQARQMCPQGQNDRLQAQILNQMGNIYRKKGDYSRALALQQQGSELAQKDGDQWALAAFLRDLGIIYLDTWDNDKALDYFQQGLQTVEHLDSQIGVAECAFLVGIIYRRLGQTEAALPQFERSLTISERLGNKWGVAHCLREIGVGYQYLGRYEEALSHLENAGRLFQELGNLNDAADLATVIGGLYAELDRYEPARDYFTQAQRSYEALDSQLAIAGAVGNLGRVYHMLGQADQARLHLDYAIGQLKELEAQFNLPFVLIQRAELAFSQGDLGSAEAFCREGLQVLHELGQETSAFMGRTCSQWGRILLARLKHVTGQKAEAIQDLQREAQASDDLEEQSIFLFAVWQLSGNNDDAKLALTLSRQLFEQQPKYLYRKQITELEAALS
jgi:DNA-binding SARP family transcriptional activator/predicted ATPase